MAISYLERIQASYPDFKYESAAVNADGQNSLVLVVDDAWIFRFPKYDHVLENLATEIAILRAVQKRLPLPVPNPQYVNLSGQTVGYAFVGYHRIPGEPLWRDTYRRLKSPRVIAALADQLASFLSALHNIPPEIIPAELAYAETHEEWLDLYRRMREKLFPFMRPDARRWAENHFEPYLDQSRNFEFTPALRHSDFGASNILYDRAKQRICGVIDFGSAGLGDPAIDFAGLLSCYGEDFIQQCRRSYPRIDEFSARIHFYRGTFALYEALFGIENNDPQAFESGIAQYR